MAKELTVASGWETETLPLFEALTEAGLKPRMIREPNSVGVATCVLIPERSRAKARMFALAWNAARNAATDHIPLVARCSDAELG